MGLKDALKNVVAEVVKEEIEKLKEIEPVDGSIPSVKKTLTYEQEMFFMEVLQRGDISEICSAAKSLFSNVNSFWAVVDTNEGIPVKHSGLAEVIVKTIMNIVAELYNEVDFSTQFMEEKDIWIQINEDQAFQTLLMRAIVDCLYFGDIAFTIGWKNDKIVLDYKRGRNLEYVYDMDGQLKEIIVLRKYQANNKTYLLKQFYGADALYVKYVLYDERANEVPLGTIEELKELKDVEITSENKYVDCSFATQFFINKSNKYDGRGASLFSTKLDALDALDEVVSQRQSVLRSGAPKEFIDESCIYKDSSNTKNINSTAMHKFYEKANTSINGNGKDIEVLQSDIRAEEYRIEEEDAKRRVLEGILSEQTVSNTSVINNTSITKEREKQTNYTISNIKKAVQDIIPRFVYNVLNVWYIYNGKNTDITPNDIVVSFDEYNNPTFENQVETCAKIKQANLLPNYEMLQELYGNTKTDEEIAMIAKKLDIMDGYDFSSLQGVETMEDAVIDNENSIKSKENSEKRNKEDENNSTADSSNLKNEKAQGDIK